MKLPWGLTSALLALAYSHAVSAAKTPEIDVSLRTSFGAAPYLLELLETAGDENSTSYLPLLDRIAEGHFSDAATDKELYERFLHVLRDDGHMTDEALSAYQLALSLRTAAPRIEAHYQYYHMAVEPSLVAEQDTSCPVWVSLHGKQYCSPALNEPHGDVSGLREDAVLAFDRALGNSSAVPSILYADITSPSFGQFHKTLSNSAKQGKFSYRLRHRVPASFERSPLVVNGYGVELALKRTDYIVIDDREGGEAKTASKSEAEANLEDEDIADLKPLSTSELLSLGLKAGSFVMQSQNPFETLEKITGDFPKYSSLIASHNVSEDFLKEHQENRAIYIPPGFNIVWMNGLQIIDRQIDAFSLLDILRKERKLISGIRELGLTGQEGIKLMGHKEIAAAQTNDEPQRFDWRDDEDGNNAIIWLNDIEVDKRYQDWPENIRAILQRTYPGQLPAIRKEVHNLVFPVDFSDPRDAELITGHIQGFVRKKIPVRFGMVPIIKTPAAIQQSRIIYHIQDTYGLAGAMHYLGKIATTGKAPQSLFESVVKDLKLRDEKEAMTLDEVLGAEKYQANIEAAQKWVERLSADSPVPPLFINGVALPRDDNWLQSFSQSVSKDLRIVQQAVFEAVVQQNDYLPDLFLASAVKRRNAIVIPEDETTIKVFDMSKLYDENKEAFQALPKVSADSEAEKMNWAHMVVVADFNTKHGQDLLSTVLQLRKSLPGIEVQSVHSPGSEATSSTFTEALFSHLEGQSFAPLDSGVWLTELLTQVKDAAPRDPSEKSAQYWKKAGSIVSSIGLAPGESGLLLNGRLVGPIPYKSEFTLDDIMLLLAYERSKRIQPVYLALEDLELFDKIATPLEAARLTSILASSTVSGIPEGVYDPAPTVRRDNFNVFTSEYTAIETGDASTAAIQIVMSIDPASEQAQRWVPIFRVLSELEGVYMRIFLNPKDRLQELPVKRFYRYVLESKPTFDESGKLADSKAVFTGVPQEALLTVGLDVPPPWLVASKESIHDLDNLKLSSIKSDVTAIYELEHILIEGHSREPNTMPPRGAQLILGTERDPAFADTIIMANVGYFQFKANPGFYKIQLKEGRSSEIFKIDSIGANGYDHTGIDGNTEVCLMSFQGATLFPRISRRPGMETEDVLETDDRVVKDIMSQGLKLAQNLFGGKGKSVSKTSDPKHAEINIFSVASGHLYERMLNIMMVSVMKHTTHTVKFWFIEQFLSPSFKAFIPHLAEAYGFEYEMVTYKWPHWLRAQTEKQREIWGYKILFLDVLFPLSLDKVIFVDADQIVRTDMIDLVNHDLKGAPYGFTPMCDSRTEMEGFRFWKQGYWNNTLKGLPYHISALYVVDLRRFRQLAAGDRLRQQYHVLSADPNSLSNLDQDLPNFMQQMLRIESLPQEWLWCETWCSDESLEKARTIDLCNNPLTKEPKLERARRQVPEWNVYDEEIEGVRRRVRGEDAEKDGEKGAKEEVGEMNTKSRTWEEPEATHTKDEL